MNHCHILFNKAVIAACVFNLAACGSSNDSEVKSISSVGKAVLTSSSSIVASSTSTAMSASISVSQSSVSQASSVGLSTATISSESSSSESIATKINFSKFTDSNFRRCVENYGVEWVEQLTQLRCYEDVFVNPTDDILDISGIEQLTSLSDLNLQYVNIKDIDLTKNTALTKIKIRNLVTVDSLYLPEGNNLTLLELNLGGSNIEEFDLSNYDLLSRLTLGAVRIPSLNLSNNLALTELDIMRSNVDALELSNNTALVRLSLFDLDGLTVLDVSENIALESVSIQNAPIVALDFSNNPNLTSLYFSSRQLSSLNLNKNDKLTHLVMFRTLLTDLNLDNNTALRRLDLTRTPQIHFDLSNNRALEEILLKGIEPLAVLKLAEGLNLKEFVLTDTPNIACSDLRMIEAQYPDEVIDGTLQLSGLKCAE